MDRFCQSTQRLCDLQSFVRGQETSSSVGIGSAATPAIWHFKSRIEMHAAKQEVAEQNGQFLHEHGCQ